jgi:hypothetical protein
MKKFSSKSDVQAHAVAYWKHNKPNFESDNKLTLEHLGYLSLLLHDCKNNSHINFDDVKENSNHTSFLLALQDYELLSFVKAKKDNGLYFIHVSFSIDIYKSPI